MSNTLPSVKSSQNVFVDASSLPASSSTSVWDRISRWVSENKALVYTVAGVAVVVTSAGVVYYLSESSRPGQEAAPTDKKKSKKERRKEKKKAEEEKKAKEEKVVAEGKPGGHFQLKLRQHSLTAASETEKKVEESEELPEVDEATVGSLSEEVRSSACLILSSS
jgi:import receptor subunit TOM70